MNGEQFNLAGHSAANHNRYRFLKDVQRIEGWNSFSKGFAVFLTNDSNYWQEGGKGYDDEDFRLHNGARKTGKLTWREPETKEKSLSANIRLAGTYTAKWESFGKGEFQYLLLEVKK